MMRRGISDYIPSTPCANPYNPPGLITSTTPMGVSGFRGLGCPTCPCVGNGIGAFLDGTGFMGTGLFAGGLDPTTWGIGEWIAIAGVGYVLYAVYEQTSRASSAASRKASAIKKGLFA